MKNDLDLLNEKLLDVIDTILDIEDGSVEMKYQRTLQLTELHKAISSWLEGEK